MTKITSSTATAARHLTIYRPSLERYSPAHGTLIPLHAYDTTTARHGTIRKDGKRPIHNNWTKRNYSSPKIIKWCVLHNNNVGVRLPATVLVIDVDPRNGGTDGFDKLCKALGLDPSMFPCVKTGGGGWHYYMLKPADVRYATRWKITPA